MIYSYQQDRVSAYQKFSDASKQLADIEAIDYFFAKQMLVSLTKSHNTKVHETKEHHVVFHLLMRLSESLRQGHSCLPLAKVANSHYGYQC